MGLRSPPAIPIILLVRKMQFYLNWSDLRIIISDARYWGYHCHTETTSRDGKKIETHT